MAATVRSGIDAWSDGAATPAAKALTTSYVADDAFDAEDADQLWLFYTTSATATTSTDFQIEASDDGGTTYYPLPAVNTGGPSSGVDDTDDHEYEGPGTNGQHSLGPIDIPPGQKIRVKAKRTGGDATSALIARGLLTKRS